ncbi:MAG TPA: hypothetical protein DIC31_05915 [Rhizobiales bacterium]|nr:hypothetical protein [Hyphomicrobiales bacterium]
MKFALHKAYSIGTPSEENLGLHGLRSLDIVAEGVETEFEAVMMTHFGCTELQGYYFSRPISADQMTQLLRTFQPKRPASAPAAVRAATTS